MNAPLLDKEDYTFELEIYGRKYTIDVTWLLHLKTGVVSDQSNIELEDSLEKIGGYLHTFSTAYEDAKQQYLTEDLQYDVWYKEHYAEAEKKLNTTFANEITNGTRSKTNSTPTNKQIEVALITYNKNEYIKRTEYLNQVKAYAEFLYREMEIIRTRGSHLQSILSKRREINNIER